MDIKNSSAYHFQENGKNKTQRQYQAYPRYFMKLTGFFFLKCYNCSFLSTNPYPYPKHSQSISRKTIYFLAIIILLQQFIIKIGVPLELS